jgi:diaminohydroxyphosphoribosylaminopyrimidine deaminase/5-amino-6-(5-phosphoribosylamino)uracil reductase
LAPENLQQSYLMYFCSVNHETYIARCIQLAKNGHGTTYPNPLVGSVIVYKDTIIGEGWHKKAGLPHAEVNAVNAVKNKSLLRESTLYVNLEPCSHFGKTPPCADMVIAAGIPEVVIGTTDPNAIVAGNGIKKLREAGIKVTVGILPEECLELNRRFFTFHQHKRPYIILKWAESADGFIAPATRTDRQPVWISNSYSRQLVHKWRSEEQAILIGTRTVIDDDPTLDVRHWSGNNPVRVVLDKNCRIPVESNVFNGAAKTIVVSETSGEAGENIFFENADFSAELPRQIGEILFHHNILSVIVEGGSFTLQSFIDANLWDEMRIFKSDVVIGKGIPAPQHNALITAKHQVGDNELLYIRNNG